MHMGLMVGDAPPSATQPRTVGTSKMQAVMLRQPVCLEAAGLGMVREFSVLRIPARLRHKALCTWVLRLCYNFPIVAKHSMLNQECDLKVSRYWP